MRVTYEDEYGTEIYSGVTESALPTPGDAVILSEEEWTVKSLTFYPAYDAVIIMITQNLVRQQQEPAADARLSEMHNAIIKLGSKQATQDKRHRTLTEQLVSLRTYLKSQQRKPQ